MRIAYNIPTSNLAGLKQKHKDVTFRFKTFLSLLNKSLEAFDADMIGTDMEEQVELLRDDFYYEVNLIVDNTITKIVDIDDKVLRLFITNTILELEQVFYNYLKDYKRADRHIIQVYKKLNALKSNINTELGAM